MNQPNIIKIKPNLLALKAISLLVVIAFSLNSALAYAQGVELNSPVTFKIPEELGSVKEFIPAGRFLGDGPPGDRPSSVKSNLSPTAYRLPLVIHIQDAHAELDAQENIQKLLQYLKKEYKLNTLYLEGGLTGEIPSNLLRFTQDRQQNDRINQKLLEKGLIGGPELLILSKDFQGYGTESLRLYKRNLAQYRNILKHKDESENFIESEKLKLSKEASNKLNPELYKFTKDYLLFQDNKQELLGHLNTLAIFSEKHLAMNLADPIHQIQYPQLVRFFKLKELDKERIADGAERIEKEKLFVWLKANKLESDVTTFESFLSAKRYTLSADLRTFLESFYREAQRKGFSFKDYPTLSKELGRMILAQELNALDLFKEIDALTAQLLETLIKTKEEREIIQAFKDLNLLNKLLHLELTSEELKLLRDGPLGDRPSTRISRPVPARTVPERLNADRSTLTAALRFYKTAELRERYIFQSMIQSMKKHQHEKVVLVTGGFHEEGLKDLITKQNLSYISIIPKIHSLDQDKTYHKVMTLQPTSTVTPPSFGRLTNINFMGSIVADYYRRELSSVMKTAGVARSELRTEEKAGASETYQELAYEYLREALKNVGASPDLASDESIRLLHAEIIRVLSGGIKLSQNKLAEAISPFFTERKTEKAHEKARVVAAAYIKSKSDVETPLGFSFPPQVSELERRQFPSELVSELLDLSQKSISNSLLMSRSEKALEIIPRLIEEFSAEDAAQKEAEVRESANAKWLDEAAHKEDMRRQFLNHDTETALQIYNRLYRLFSEVNRVIQEKPLAEVAEALRLIQKNIEDLPYKLLLEETEEMVLKIENLIKQNEEQPWLKKYFIPRYRAIMQKTRWSSAREIFEGVKTSPKIKNVDRLSYLRNALFAYLQETVVPSLLHSKAFSIRLLELDSQVDDLIDPGMGVTDAEAFILSVFEAEQHGYVMFSERLRQIMSAISEHQIYRWIRLGEIKFSEWFYRSPRAELLHDLQLKTDGINQLIADARSGVPGFAMEASVQSELFAKLSKLSSKDKVHAVLQNIVSEFEPIQALQKKIGLFVMASEVQFDPGFAEKAKELSERYEPELSNIENQLTRDLIKAYFQNQAENFEMLRARIAGVLNVLNYRGPGNTYPNHKPILEKKDALFNPGEKSLDLKTVGNIPLLAPLSEGLLDQLDVWNALVEIYKSSDGLMREIPRQYGELLEYHSLLLNHLTQIAGTQGKVLRRSELRSEEIERGVSFLKGNLPDVIFLDFGQVLGTQIEDYFDETVRRLMNFSGLQFDENSDEYSVFLANIHKLLIPGRESSEAGLPTRNELFSNPAVFDRWIEIINDYLLNQGAERRVTREEFEEAYYGPRSANPAFSERLLDLLIIKHALGIKFGVISNFEAAGKQRMLNLYLREYPGLIDEELVVISGEAGAVKSDSAKIFRKALNQYKKMTGKTAKNVVFIDNFDWNFPKGREVGIQHFIHYAFAGGEAAFQNDQLFNATLHDSPNGNFPYFESMLALARERMNSELRSGPKVPAFILAFGAAALYGLTTVLAKPVLDPHVGNVSPLSYMVTLWSAAILKLFYLDEKVFGIGKLQGTDSDAGRFLGDGPPGTDLRSFAEKYVPMVSHMKLFFKLMNSPKVIASRSEEVAKQSTEIASVTSETHLAMTQLRWDQKIFQNLKPSTLVVLGALFSQTLGAGTLYLALYLGLNPILYSIIAPLGIVVLPGILAKMWLNEPFTASKRIGYGIVLTGMLSIPAIQLISSGLTVQVDHLAAFFGFLSAVFYGLRQIFHKQLTNKDLSFLSESEKKQLSMLLNLSGYFIGTAVMAGIALATGTSFFVYAPGMLILTLLNMVVWTSMWDLIFVVTMNKNFSASRLTPILATFPFWTMLWQALIMKEFDPTLFTIGLGVLGGGVIASYKKETFARSELRMGQFALQVNGRTNLDLSPSGWDSPELYELNQQDSGAQTARRFKFKIIGTAGYWVPLVDKSTVPYQIVLVHIVETEGRQEVLPDYFVLRLDPSSQKTLVDLHAEKAGVASYKLLYFQKSPKLGGSPVPVRIPEIESSPNAFTNRRLIGTIAAAMGMSRLFWHYGQQFKKRPWNIWLTDPDFNDPDHRRAFLEPYIVRPDSTFGRIEFYRDERNERMPDVLGIDERGLGVLIGEFGRHTVLEHALKNARGTKTIFRFRSLMGSGSRIPKRIIFYADIIDHDEYAEAITHVQYDSIQESLSDFFKKRSDIVTHDIERDREWHRAENFLIKVQQTVNEIQKAYKEFSTAAAEENQALPKRLFYMVDSAFRLAGEQIQTGAITEFVLQNGEYRLKDLKLLSEFQNLNRLFQNVNSVVETISSGQHRSELRNASIDSTVRGQAALFWFNAEGGYPNGAPEIVIDHTALKEAGFKRNEIKSTGWKLKKSLENAFYSLSPDDQRVMLQAQRDNKGETSGSKFVEFPLPLRVENNLQDSAIVTPHEIILDSMMLRAPPSVLTFVLLHGLRRSLHRFYPDLQPHDAAIFQKSLEYYLSNVELQKDWQEWTATDPVKNIFGRDWLGPVKHATQILKVHRGWKSLTPDRIRSVYSKLTAAKKIDLSASSTQLIFKSEGLEVPHQIWRETFVDRNHQPATDLYVSYKLEEGVNKIVRIAKNNPKDWISVEDTSDSVILHDLRLDVVWDAKDVAQEIIKQRIILERYPELIDLINSVTQGTEIHQQESISKLKELAGEGETEIGKVALDLLFSLSKTFPNRDIRIELNRYIFDRMTGRPSHFPVSAFNYSAFDSQDHTVRVKLPAVSDKTRVQVEWSENGSATKVTELEASSDDKAVFNWKVPVKTGWVHYAFQVKNEKTDWAYLKDKNIAQVNGLIKFQQDVRSRRILSLRPEVFNLRLENLRSLYDENGNLRVGTLEDLKKQLKDIKNQGFGEIYLQTLETGARGEAGPDPSVFSPLNHRLINHKIGGMKALLELKKTADEIGIELSLDMIPHISRSNREVAARTPVWIYDVSGKNPVRRAASDGGFSPDWLDSFARNWADPQNVRDLIEELSILAKAGFNFRVDVGHVFDITFETDPSTRGLAKILGQAVTVNKEWKQFEGEWREFSKTLDLNDTNEPNSVLAWIIYEVKKAGLETGRRTKFYAEQWHGHEARLIQSGVDFPYDPMVANFWQMIRKGASTHEVMNTLRYLANIWRNFGGGTASIGSNHDAEVAAVDAFGNAVFAALMAGIFASGGVFFQHIHYSFRKESGSIDWEKALAEIWRVYVNNFGPGSNWKGKIEGTEAALRSNPFFRGLSEFYKTVFKILRLAKSKPIALDVGHDRVVGIARQVRENEYLLMLSHLGSPYAADINFHPDDSRQNEQGLGDFEDGALYLLEEIFNNEKPGVSIKTPGERTLFTGLEIKKLGLGPRFPVSILGHRVYRFKKEETVLPNNNSKAYKALLRDSLARYKRYGPKDRFKNSFVAQKIVKILKAKKYESFRTLFRALAEAVEKDANINVGDLSSLFHDVITYEPKLKPALHQALIDVAIISRKEKNSARSVIVPDVAIRVLRSHEIGEIVLTSPETMWTSGTGGLATYVSDLAKELASMGVPVTVISPLFSNQKADVFKKYNLRDTGRTVAVKFGQNGRGGFETAVAKIYEVNIDGVRVLLLENGKYFQQLKGKPWMGESGYEGSAPFRLRFSRMLSLATLLTIREMNIHASIIQTNEWSTAYVKAYLEGRERIDPHAMNLRSDDHLAEAKVISILHNLGNDYQGRVTTHSDDERNAMIEHDLGFSRELDWDVLVTLGETNVINPTFTAIQTADHARTVSEGYYKRSLEMNYNAEFGGLVPVLIEKNRAGAYDGILNGFGLVAKQNDFLKKMIKDPEIVKRLRLYLDQPYSYHDPVYRRWLQEKVLLNPDDEARSFLEMGHQHERERFARFVYDFIRPLQKEGLQRAFNLEAGDDKLVYAMFHRISDQKGFQLLLADIWRRDDPKKLQTLDGQWFEEMGIGRQLDDASYQKLMDYAHTHDRPTLRAAEVAMILMPNLQMIVAGGVDKDYYSNGFSDLAHKFQRQFRYRGEFINSENTLHELINSGSDEFGMPSLFEPGGISNEEAASYGTRRHLSRRDGLRDHEIQIDGFSEAFDPFNPVSWLISLNAHYDFAQDPKNSEKLRQIHYLAITQDNRWLKHARKYVEKYHELNGSSSPNDLVAIEAAGAINRAQIYGKKDPADELMKAGFTAEQAVESILLGLMYSKNTKLNTAITHSESGLIEYLSRIDHATKDLLIQEIALRLKGRLTPPVREYFKKAQALVSRSELRARSQASQFIFPDQIQPDDLLRVGNKAVKLAGFERYLNEKEFAVNIPSWFVVPKDTAMDLVTDQEFLSKHGPALTEALAKLATDRERFGSLTDPFLISLRASDPEPFPGRYLTVLNIGINDQNVEALGRKLSDERQAWRLYAKLIREFAVSIGMIRHADFTNMADLRHLEPQAENEKDLNSIDGLRWLVRASKKRYQQLLNEEFPQDPMQQFMLAAHKVAALERHAKMTPNNTHSFIVQRMVFGNLENSLAGVVYSRNPWTGDAKSKGYVGFNVQGDEPLDTDESNYELFKKKFPKEVKQLEEMLADAETYLQDIAGIEFTVEKGRLHLLQLRVATKYPLASIRTYVDMAKKGAMTKAQALERLQHVELDVLKYEPLKDNDLPKNVKFAASALSVGYERNAIGVAAFSLEKAMELKRSGFPVILVRPVITANDETAMRYADAAITGQTFGHHLPEIALKKGVPAVMGLGDQESDVQDSLVVDYETGTALLGRSGAYHQLEDGKTVLLVTADGKIFISEESPEELKGEYLNRRKKYLPPELVEILIWQVEAAGKEAKLIVDHYGTSASFHEVAENEEMSADEYQKSKNIVRYDGKKFLVGVRDVISDGQKAIQQVSEQEKRVIPLGLAEEVAAEVIQKARQHQTFFGQVEEFTYLLWRYYVYLESKIAERQGMNPDIFDSSIGYVNTDEARGRYFSYIAHHARALLVAAVVHGVGRHKHGASVFKTALVKEHLDKDFARDLVVDVIRYAAENGYTGNEKGHEWQVARLFSSLTKSNIEFGVSMLRELKSNERKWLILHELNPFYVTRELYQKLQDPDFAEPSEIVAVLKQASQEGLLENGVQADADLLIQNLVNIKTVGSAGAKSESSTRSELRTVRPENLADFQAELLHRGNWWKDPSKTNIAVSLPIFALRREGRDFGIGKLTDLGTYFRDILMKQGINTILLLPHFATIDESPYAPVSSHAINELYIDWSVVEESSEDSKVSPNLSLKERQSVHYELVRKRENAIAMHAFKKFKTDHLDKGTERDLAFQDFVNKNRWWLDDYVEFLALYEILGKLPRDPKTLKLQWLEYDIREARANPQYKILTEKHRYTQWIAYGQLKEAVDIIHQEGGHILFDAPMFRAKDSMAVWKFPQYFRDIETGYPGVQIEGYVNEHWRDLALWNWKELRQENYRAVLSPVRYWLEFGFDGARMDALHFAYDFEGKLGRGDEPGDDFVRAAADIFKEHDALPIAEAFNGAHESAARHGFLPVHWDWRQLSSHDDPRLYSRLDEFSAKAREFLNKKHYFSGKHAKFISFALGDQWGDGERIKKMSADGKKSFWHYRIPLPSDPDYKVRARFDASEFLRGLSSQRSELRSFQGETGLDLGKIFDDFILYLESLEPHVHQRLRIKRDPGSMVIKNGIKSIWMHRFMEDLVDNALDEQREGIIEIGIKKTEAGKVEFYVINEGAIAFDVLRERARIAAREKRLFREDNILYFYSERAMAHFNLKNYQLISESELERIPNEELLYIYGLSRGKKAEDRGKSGIGLTQVRQGIREWGGDVEVKSDGNKVTFSFLLDLAPEVKSELRGVKFIKLVMALFSIGGVSGCGMISGWDWFKHKEKSVYQDEDSAYYENAKRIIHNAEIFKKAFTEQPKQSIFIVYSRHAHAISLALQEAGAVLIWPETNLNSLHIKEPRRKSVVVSDRLAAGVAIPKNWAILFDPYKPFDLSNLPSIETLRRFGVKRIIILSDSSNLHAVGPFGVSWEFVSYLKGLQNAGKISVSIANVSMKDTKSQGFELPKPNRIVLPVPQPEDLAPSNRRLASAQNIKESRSELRAPKAITREERKQKFITAIQRIAARGDAVNIETIASETGHTVGTLKRIRELLHEAGMPKVQSELFGRLGRFKDLVQSLQNGQKEQLVALIVSLRNELILSRSQAYALIHFIHYSGTEKDSNKAVQKALGFSDLEQVSRLLHGREAVYSKRRGVFFLVEDQPEIQEFLNKRKPLDDKAIVRIGRLLLSHSTKLPVLIGKLKEDERSDTIIKKELNVEQRIQIVIAALQGKTYEQIANELPQIVGDLRYQKSSPSTIAAFFGQDKKVIELPGAIPVLMQTLTEKGIWREGKINSENLDDAHATLQAIYKAAASKIESYSKDINPSEILSVLQVFDKKRLPLSKFVKSFDDYSREKGYPFDLDVAFNAAIEDKQNLTSPELANEIAAYFSNYVVQATGRPADFMDALLHILRPSDNYYFTMDETAQFFANVFSGIKRQDHRQAWGEALVHFTKGKFSPQAGSIAFTRKVYDRFVKFVFPRMQLMPEKEIQALERAKKRAALIVDEARRYDFGYLMEAKQKLDQRYAETDLLVQEFIKKSPLKAAASFVGLTEDDLGEVGETIWNAAWDFDPEIAREKNVTFYTWAIGALQFKARQMAHLKGIRSERFRQFGIDEHGRAIELENQRTPGFMPLESMSLDEEKNKRIKDALKIIDAKFPEREQMIFRLMHGLDAEFQFPLEYQQVAEVLISRNKTGTDTGSISHQRVEQIYKEVLSQLIRIMNETSPEVIDAWRAAIRNPKNIVELPAPITTEGKGAAIPLFDNVQLTGYRTAGPGAKAALDGKLVVVKAKRSVLGEGQHPDHHLIVEVNYLGKLLGFSVLTFSPAGIFTHQEYKQTWNEAVQYANSVKDRVTARSELRNAEDPSQPLSGHDLIEQIRKLVTDREYKLAVKELELFANASIPRLGDDNIARVDVDIFLNCFGLVVSHFFQNKQANHSDREAILNFHKIFLRYFKAIPAPLFNTRSLMSRVIAISQFATVLRYLDLYDETISLLEIIEYKFGERVNPFIQYSLIKAHESKAAVLWKEIQAQTNAGKRKSFEAQKVLEHMKIVRHFARGLPYFETNDMFDKMVQGLHRNSFPSLLEFINLPDSPVEAITEINQAFYEFVKAIGFIVREDAAEHDTKRIQPHLNAYTYFLTRISEYWLKHHGYRIAHEASEIMVALNPQDPYGFHTLVHAAAELGKIDEAQDALKALRVLHSDFDIEKLERRISIASSKVLEQDLSGQLLGLAKPSPKPPVAMKEQVEKPVKAPTVKQFNEQKFRELRGKIEEFRNDVTTKLQKKKITDDTILELQGNLQTEIERHSAELSPEHQETLYSLLWEPFEQNDGRSELRREAVVVARDVSELVLRNEDAVTLGAGRLFEYLRDWHPNAYAEVERENYASLLKDQKQAANAVNQLIVVLEKIPAKNDPYVQVLSDFLKLSKLSKARIIVPDADRAQILEAGRELGIRNLVISGSDENVTSLIQSYAGRTLIYDFRNEMLQTIENKRDALKHPDDILLVHDDAMLENRAFALLNAIEFLYKEKDLRSFGVASAMGLLALTENLNIRNRAELLLEQAA